MDIVEKLRTAAEDIVTAKAMLPAVPVIYEAADEIERLREALRNLLHAFQDCCVGLAGDTHEAEFVAMKLIGEPHWTQKQKKGQP